LCLISNALEDIRILNPNLAALVPKKNEEMDCNRFPLNMFLWRFMAAKMIKASACGAMAGPPAARSVPACPSP